MKLKNSYTFFQCIIAFKLFSQIAGQICMADEYLDSSCHNFNECGNVIILAGDIGLLDNQCRSSCADALTINLIVDSNGICVACHSDCKSGQCTEGGNAIACIECSSPTSYLNSGECVLASVCPGVAINASDSSSGINICATACTEATTINLVKNSDNICEACHSNCASSKCTEGGNAATCTECSSPTSYLNSGECILASACPGGTLKVYKIIYKVAINASDSSSGINICATACTEATTINLVKNSDNICEACHSNCASSKCTEGGNAATCTECSSPTSYLNSGECILASACPGGTLKVYKIIYKVAINASDSSIGINICATACTEATTINLVKNSDNICEACHSNCASSKCTEGGNAATCTECSSPTSYLNSGECILASACPGGTLKVYKIIYKVAINASDSSSGINICATACTEATTINLVKNSDNICETCHSNCASSKCTEGGNAVACTECNLSTMYLNGGSCIVSTSCSVAINAADSASGVNICSPSCTDAITIDLGSINSYINRILVINADNICTTCHNTCKSGLCTEGDNLAACTGCMDNLYLQSGECVVSTACTGVLNAVNICIICHTDCAAEKCTKSQNSSACTECSSPTSYLNSGECILASACPGGTLKVYKIIYKVAINASDSSSGINICATACTEATTINLVTNSDNICEACHSNCASSKCTEGGNAATCTECSSPTSYLNSGECVLANACPGIAINASDSSSGINICATACTEATTINLVKNSNNICEICHSNCVIAKCTEGGNAAACIECQISTNYFNSGECVLASACPGVAINASDSSSGLNICATACSEATTINLVKNSDNICEICHSDCVIAKCTEGGNAATCTECSSPTSYLNSGECILASACPGVKNSDNICETCHSNCASSKCTEGGNAVACTECNLSTMYLNGGSCIVSTSCSVAINAADSASGVNICSPSCTDAITIDLGSINSYINRILVINADNICTTCHNTCKSGLCTEGDNLAACTGCMDNLYLQSGECVVSTACTGVLNAVNICIICHTDCAAEKCTKSYNASACTECSSTTSYLNSGECVLASACSGVAINASDSSSGINICATACSEATTINLVKNSDNICEICHSDCVIAKCTEGGNAATCTECSSPTSYLNSGECVLASTCSGVAINASDSSSGINICATACSEATTINLVKNSDNICEVCHSDCASGKCTEGGNAVACTECFSSSKYLNSAICVDPIVCTVAIKATQSSSSINICGSSCSEATVLNLVPNSNHICAFCDSSCQAGYCSISEDSTKCQQCDDSTNFLSTIPGECVVLASCPNYGVNSTYSGLGLNICVSDCSGYSLIPNSDNLCTECHISCNAGQCTEGENDAACTNCSATYFYNGSYCVSSINCPSGQVALLKDYTIDTKSICTTACNDGTAINLVANINNICEDCHSDCIASKCKYGGNSAYCTECSDTQKYLNITADNYGNCVSSSDCPSVAILAINSTSGINQCYASCSLATVTNLVMDANKLCLQCHSDCVVSNANCTVGNDSTKCTVCSSATRYLQNPSPNSCVASSSCTNVAINSTHSSTGINQCFTDCTSATVTNYGTDGFCTESENSNKCTKCASSSYYLESYPAGSCVLSTACASLHAIQSVNSLHSINECVSSCSDSTQSHLVLDINNLCLLCHSDCADGECSYSNDNTKCLICKDSDKFIQYPEASGSICVVSTLCISVGVLGADTINGHNECWSSCSNINIKSNRIGDIILDSTNICKDCHSDCNVGNCTVGADQSFCTNCSASNKYLQNNQCVDSTSCTNCQIQFQIVIYYYQGAIKKINSNSNINECVTSCSIGIDIPGLDKICIACHSDCIASKCKYGGNSAYCTECSDTQKYLNITADNYGNCVASSDCPSVAILAINSTSGINQCYASCSLATVTNLVMDANKLCLQCHSDCIVSNANCTVGNDSTKCTVCSSATRYLQNPSPNSCVASSSCTNVAINSTHSSTGINQCFTDCTSATVTNYVPNSDNICNICHSDCYLKKFILNQIKCKGTDGFCTESENSNKCTKCASSSYYLKSYPAGSCVLSTACASLHAIQSVNSLHSINECVSSCSDSTQSHLVPDINNLCLLCHSDCADGECSYSNDNTKCLICKDSDKFIQYPEASGSICVVSTLCISVGVLGADTINGHNECWSSCSNINIKSNRIGDIILDSTNICKDCHSDCNVGNCTVGADQSFCTNCSASNKYLQSNQCVDSTSCTNCQIQFQIVIYYYQGAIKKINSNSNINECVTSCSIGIDIPGFDKICIACHSDCIASKCKYGDNSAYCTECSDTQKYLNITADNYGNCVASSDCPSVAILAINSTSGINQCYASCSLATVTNLVMDANKLCLQCHSDCVVSNANCTVGNDSTKCTVCSSATRYLQNPSPNSCVASSSCTNVAINSTHSFTGINQCFTDCTSATVTNYVPNSDNICNICHSDCTDGFCTESENSNKCTKCASSSYYLKSYSVGSCVLSTACASLYAIQSVNSWHSINECVTSCSDSPQSYLLPDINNLCLLCHSDCVDTECSYSNDSAKCLICSDSDKFIAYPEASGSTCVSSDSCPTGSAVLGVDTINGYNECWSSCSDVHIKPARIGIMVTDSDSVCKDCHTDCVVASCTVGNSSQDCTNCSDTDKYLSNGECLISTNCPDVAIIKNNSALGINQCVSDCSGGLNNTYVATLQQICLPCHSDCVIAKCAFGDNAIYCTECSDSNKYLNITTSNYGNCVTSNNCPAVAILALNSPSGINQCYPSCASANENNLVMDANQLCLECHSDCVVSNASCTVGNDSTKCTACGSISKYLQNPPPNSCVDSTACISVAINASDSSTLKNECFDNCTFSVLSGSVPNINNICENCHLDCKNGKCTEGGNADKCTECKLSTKYLQNYPVGKCVISTDCLPSHALYQTKSLNLINECVTSCTNSISIYFVPNSQNICSDCHSDCVKGQCSLSLDDQKCLICSASNKFLYDPSAGGTACVDSLSCPSGKTAVLGSDAVAGYNQCLSSCLDGAILPARLGFIVVDIKNVCSDCHSDCYPGDCNLGNSSSNCTNCSVANKYLQDGECVASTICYDVAINRNNSNDNINRCVVNCQEGVNDTFVQNFVQICYPCHPDCKDGKCTLSQDNTKCTECSDSDKYLQFGLCVQSIGCNTTSYQDWVAIKASTSIDNINKCYENCSCASTSNLVADSANVCVPCDNDCESGQCSVGDDSNKCLECYNNSNKFLQKSFPFSYGYCTGSLVCSNHGLQASYSLNSINECIDDCLDLGYVTEDNLVPDQNNICLPCHSSCKPGKCNFGNDSHECTECNLVDNFLQEGECVQSMGCANGNIFIYQQIYFQWRFKQNFQKQELMNAATIAQKLQLIL